MSASLAAPLSSKASIAQRPQAKAFSRAGGARAGRGAPFVVRAADIVETARAQGLYKLVAAIETAGLTNELKDGSKNYCVFAPSEDAFARYTNGTLTPDDVRAHVCRGKLLARHIANYPSLPLLGGGEVKIKGSNNSDVVIAYHGNEVTIMRSDILADNGVIHVIDAPLMASTGLPSSPAAAGANGLSVPSAYSTANEVDRVVPATGTVRIKAGRIKEGLDDELAEAERALKQLTETENKLKAMAAQASDFSSADERAAAMLAARTSPAKAPPPRPTPRGRRPVPGPGPPPPPPPPPGSNPDRASKASSSSSSEPLPSGWYKPEVKSESVTPSVTPTPPIGSSGSIGSGDFKAGSMDIKMPELDFSENPLNDILGETATDEDKAKGLALGALGFLAVIAVLSGAVSYEPSSVAPAPSADKPAIKPTSGAPKKPAPAPSVAAPPVAAVAPPAAPAEAAPEKADAPQYAGIEGSLTDLATEWKNRYEQERRKTADLLSVEADEKKIIAGMQNALENVRAEKDKVIAALEQKTAILLQLKTEQEQVVADLQASLEGLRAEKQVAINDLLEAQRSSQGREEDQAVIVKLQTALEQVRAEKDAVVADLEERLSSADQVRREEERIIANMQDAAERLGQEKESIAMAVSQKEAALAQAKQEEAQLQARLEEETRNIVGQKDAIIASMQGALDSVRAEKNAIIAELQAKATNFEQVAAGEAEMVAQLNSKLAAAATAEANADAQITNLNQAIETMKQEEMMLINDLRGAMEKARAEKDAVISALEAKASALEQVQVEQQEAVRTLKDTLDKVNSEKDAEIATLQEKVAILDQVREREEQAIANLEKKSLELEKVKQQQGEAIQKLEAKGAADAATIDQLAESKKVLADDLDAARKTINQQMRESLALRSQVTNLSTELDEVKEAQARQLRERKALADLVRKLKTEETQLQSEVENVARLRKNAEDQVRALQAAASSDFSADFKLPVLQ